MFFSPKSIQNSTSKILRNLYKKLENTKHFKVLLKQIVSRKKHQSKNQTILNKQNHREEAFMSPIVARISGVKKLIQEDYPFDWQGTRARQVAREGSPNLDITIVNLYII